ncbi:TonB-dependent receptor domain-containing protein [Hahella ganghwensis]|uniref:TonB-dependent receptor domain-containing protein n=1 Tax=Hahella ganghwensis TaxID=286420 RepID=UPI00036E9BD5|nr:TonB-dependent receptor [Hahella ganghwensis]
MVFTQMSCRLLAAFLPVSLATLSPLALAIEDTTTDPVIVTATRTAQTANESLSTVRVLTREEIIQRQAKSLPDLLRGEAGMHFVNNGGRGKNTSLFIRGTESDHILVLIDGVKVGSATSGNTPFQDIPIEQIERIEIVRGPRSSLYGSEAIGGVIQIFTRRGEGGVTPSLSVTAGSYDTFEGSAGVSGSVDGFFYNFSVSGVTTNGFNACHPEAATAFGGCYADEPDNDGYENLSSSLRIGYQFDGGSELSLNSLGSQNESDFDGNSQNQSETLQRLLGIQSSIVITDIWLLNMNVGRSLDESDNFLNGEFKSSFDTRRDTATIQNDFMLFDRDTFSLGVDYLHDKIDTYGDQNFDSVIDETDQFEDLSRENYGAYAQYLMSMDGYDIELSIRHDDNGQFGSHWTGGIGYGMEITDSVRFIATYGTAYKAPSFNELYYPGYGNSELAPEESETIEIGLRGAYPETQWAVTYFNTHVDELISYDSTTFLPGNIDKAKINGVEIVVDHRFLQHWQLGVDLTIQDPRNDSAGANQGKLLTRRPERSARMDLDYHTEVWSVGATLVSVGRSYDDLGNSRKVDGYETLDVRAQIELVDSWLLQGRVENVFDVEYETASYFNQPGLGFYLTLRYAPE